MADENKKNKIIARLQYAARLELKSPLCVSGGDGEATDTDVQRNFDGQAFIPGTTMAGAMRAYLTGIAYYDESKIDFLFGSRNDEGQMSRIQFSDIYFEEKKVNIVQRDGVALEDKLAVDGAKYDMEAIDTGATCICYILVTIRETDKNYFTVEDADDMVKAAFAGIQNGNIRLGAKKNRGYGELEVVEIFKSMFDSKNIFDSKNGWLSFDKKKMLQDQEEVVCDDITESVKKLSEEGSSNFLTIKVPLHLKGGISIRQYTVEPNKPDFRHIQSGSNKKTESSTKTESSNEKEAEDKKRLQSVIPGTSWCGAIRNRVRYFLNKLGCKEKESLGFIDTWFGYVKEKESQQSNVIIGESVIKGGTDKVMTRNRIDRFDASTVPGALYTEQTHFGGTCELDIKIRKNQKDYRPIVGLIIMAVKDIQNGYLAVGGQTAIGRGIFEKQKDIEYIGLADGENENDFIQSVGELVKEGN